MWQIEQKIGVAVSILRNLILIIASLISYGNLAAADEPEVDVCSLTPGQKSAPIQKVWNIQAFPDFYARRLVTESEFDQVIDNVKSLYPMSSVNSVPIEYLHDWNDPYGNGTTAYCSNSKNYRIYIRGAVLSYFPRVDKSGLAALVCHEVGHVMGGIEKSRVSFTDRDGTKNDHEMNVSEGFADYFATNRCLKLYYDRFVAPGMQTPAIDRIRDLCSSVENKEQCIFALNASYNIQRALNGYSHRAEQPGFDPVDHVNWSVADSTINSLPFEIAVYPEPACRFDTMIAGYFCDRQGTPCGFDDRGNYTEGGPSIALPPRCFYNP